MIYQFVFSPRQVTELGASKQTTPNISYLRPDDEEMDRTLFDTTNIDNSQEIRSYQPPAFEALEKALKDYLSDIQVPTKDALRSEPVNVRVAGGDKTILIWKQDLKSGRIKLPVISINRGSISFNSEKFTPPYVGVSRVYLDNGDRIREAFRPVPYLIEYIFSMWTERKRDIEHILAQLMPRMNPLATFDVDDGRHIYTAVMKFNSCNNTSDIDAAAEELAKVRYDMSVTVEGYIPVAHTVIKKTILGKLGVIREMNGKYLEKIDPGSRHGYGSFNLRPEN